MNRKEWLEAKINYLADKSLFDGLAEQDELWLGAYKEEYRLILAGEEK